ncbi:hypothetical protein LIS82_12105 [Cytobacillus solani]|uniref:hypothetical protein n=1 Tax=Cytobacillus solani TaxID=1637975 RepID=UPI00207A39B9|nr:hypothetical protein [Cytobacillus solani]USK57157.1 hypothetical protein LIS82_12105 [Cytobacillus solani]
MNNVYYDFWYLKSEEIDLEGNDTCMTSYEIALGVFADKDHFKQLDDIRITGLKKDEMLSFCINQPDKLFPKLEEEGLFNIVEHIKKNWSLQSNGRSSN